MFTAAAMLTLSLVLNLQEKMSYFKKHWAKELQEDVLKCVKEVVSYICTFSGSGLRVNYLLV